MAQRHTPNCKKSLGTTRFAQMRGALAKPDAAFPARTTGFLRFRLAATEFAHLTNRSASNRPLFSIALAPQRCANRYISA
jgi:hypothetical protein